MNKDQPMMKTVADGSRIFWHMRLHSAFRTALACAIVGCITLYGPESLRNHLKFSAFSYLTAVLIVSDATLGDTIRGCWHAFYATIQVVPLSMFSLWLISPARVSTAMAALIVALFSFLVALPNSTHLMSKRIAFGQIVIMFVDPVVHGEDTGAKSMHPLHVASCTALGAIASVLAMLLPYPRLAHYEVRNLCQLYEEYAFHRMNLYFKAFGAPNNQRKVELISQAKPIAATGSKLLQHIRIFEEGLLWETPWSRWLKSNCIRPGDQLKCMEVHMRGTEIALNSFSASPAGVLDQEPSNVVQCVLTQLTQKIQQIKCFTRLNSVTSHETGEFIYKSILPLTKTLHTQGYLSVLFFLSCVEMFLNDSTTEQKSELVLRNKEFKESEGSREEEELNTKGVFRSCILKLKDKRVKFAFKCSLSLGLAVLFGLIFDKENGCWSGLTIAISFVTGRQAIFTVANTRVQGTALGSVYGVLGCFLFQKHAELRWLAFLPWIIFTSFLKHSHMYGQTGGISAAIGALLILGRKKYGDPNEFAISRLTEVFIGLSCFIFVELSMQPRRAATMAKTNLHESLEALQECVKQVYSLGWKKDQPSYKLHELRERQSNLKSLVKCLENFMVDAELEPDFWFSPFRSSCYQKVLRGLSNTADLMHFIIYNIEAFMKLPQSNGIHLRDLQEHIDNDLELFQEALTSSIRVLERIASYKSSAISQEPKNRTLENLEEGKTQNANTNTSNALDAGDGETHKLPSYFPHQSTEVNERVKESADAKMILFLGALDFCISCLKKQIQDIQMGVQEIVHWECPSSR